MCSSAQLEVNHHVLVGSFSINLGFTCHARSENVDFICIDLEDEDFLITLH